LGFRATALWLLGYPEAALADSAYALEDARQIGQGRHFALSKFYVDAIAQQKR
jgi:hypothetical protein